jgi:hypothetical protein
MKELSYCAPLGIPHSEFLSWDTDDQDKALAFAELKAQTCACGTRREEWDEAAGGSRFAYAAHTYRCPGCELLEQESKNVPDGEMGVKYTLVTPEVSARLLAASAPEPEATE